MLWFLMYWQEFYIVIGVIILLCVITAFIMDYRDYRKSIKHRKDWWRHDPKE